MGKYIGTGLASGGIIPKGYPNDSFHARLSSDEAVIPLSNLRNMLSGNSQHIVVTVEGDIKGSDIHISNQRRGKLIGRYT